MHSESHIVRNRTLQERKTELIMSKLFLLGKHLFCAHIPV